MLPIFSAVDFLSFYIEVPVIVVMYLTWALLHRPAVSHSSETTASASSPLLSHSTPGTGSSSGKWWFTDLVDFQSVDLNSDQYEDDDADKHDEEQRASRTGIWRRLYYWLA